MSNRYVGLGMFVIVGTLLFGAGVFLIGSRHSVFAKHIELFTGVNNLNGLTKGAKIEVEGFDAGEVTGIDIQSAASTRFRLTLRVSEPVRRLVRQDSIVTIATEGVLGGSLTSVTVMVRAFSNDSPPESVVRIRIA